jgi:hypothetical protein
VNVITLLDNYDSEFNSSNKEFKLLTSRYSTRYVSSDNNNLSSSKSLFDGASVTKSSAETNDESDPQPVSRRSKSCNLQLNVPSTVRKRSVNTVLEFLPKRSANPTSFLMSSGASPTESFSDDASAAESSSAAKNSSIAENSSTASAVISDNASALRGLDDMDFWQ